MDTFQSEKPGYVFKYDIYGQGYYADEEAGKPVEIGLEQIMKDKSEKREREAKSHRQALPKFDAIAS